MLESGNYARRRSKGMYDVELLKILSGSLATAFLTYSREYVRRLQGWQQLQL